MTSQQLAELCGVSRGTVDRVLKNRPGVAEHSRRTVLEAVRKYHYRPNFAGRALVSGKTGSIGMVIFDFRHDFFAELYSAFESACNDRDHVLLPMLSYHNPAHERESLDRLVDRNSDGILLLPVNQGAEFEAYLQNLGVPVAVLSNRLSDAFPFSGLDDYAAARDAATHLRRTRRVIHYLAPPLREQENGAVNLYAQTQRARGWRESGVDGGFFTSREALLTELAPGDAVLAANDAYAIELQLHLRERRPELYSSVKLMGFDGLDVLRYASPAIATVTFDRAEWAARALDQIFARMAGENAPDAVIPHRVVDVPEEP